MITVDHRGSLIPVAHLGELALTSGNSIEASASEDEGSNQCNAITPPKHTLEIPHVIYHDERLDDETLQKFFFSKINQGPTSKMRPVGICY